MRRNEKPCRKHKLAAPSWQTPEIIGMLKHGERFEECSRCGWIVSKKLLKKKGKQ